MLKDYKKKCLHCGVTLREPAVFCWACGAYIKQIPPPVIFSRTEEELRKRDLLIMLNYLFPIGAIGAYISLGCPDIFGFDTPLRHLPLSGKMFFALFAVLIVGSFWYEIFILRSGIICPACQNAIPYRWVKQSDTPYCPLCGTRIRAGKGKRLKNGINEDTVNRRLKTPSSDKARARCAGYTENDTANIENISKSFDKIDGTSQQFDSSMNCETEPNTNECDYCAHPLELFMRYCPACGAWCTSYGTFSKEIHERINRWSFLGTCTKPSGRFPFLGPLLTVMFVFVIASGKKDPSFLPFSIAFAVACILLIALERGSWVVIMERQKIKKTGCPCPGCGRDMTKLIDYWLPHYCPHCGIKYEGCTGSDTNHSHG